MDLSQYQPYILVGVPALTSVIVSGLLTPYLTEKARAKDRSLEKLKLRTDLQKAQYPEKMKVSA